MLFRGTSDQYGLHINIVVIGELLWRDPMRVHSEYNKNVTDTNSALYNMIQTDAIPQIIFWGRHGFWKDFLISAMMVFI